MQRKNQTCKKCKYRDGRYCRKFPPPNYNKLKGRSFYPVIFGYDKNFRLACSYYKER